MTLPKTALFAALLLPVLPTLASANDCSGFLGKFRGAGGVIAEITEGADGALSIKIGETGAATATCIAPLEKDGKSYPQATATGLTADIDEAFADPACCTMLLNGNQMYFQPSGRFWQRTK